MGNLRPYGYSPNKRSFARCVAVVIVKLLSNMSCTLCGMRCKNTKQSSDCGRESVKTAKIGFKWRRFVKIWMNAF